MGNPITGHHTIEIEGRPYTIRFDWDCLAQVEAAHGDSPNLFNPEILAAVAAIGMKKSHSEMTAEKIKELSPPLKPFADQVTKAMLYAYFGPEKVEASTEKKRALPGGGLWHRIRRLLKLGSARPSSGS